MCRLSQPTLGFLVGLEWVYLIKGLWMVLFNEIRFVFLFGLGSCMFFELGFEL